MIISKSADIKKTATVRFLDFFGLLERKKRVGNKIKFLERNTKIKVKNKVIL